MIYFTDMLLVPSDNPAGSRELRDALNGSGMVRCAQVEAQADMAMDVVKVMTEIDTYDRETKSFGDTPYHDEVQAELTKLMSLKDNSVEWETGGAWGGPGGSSEAWGITRNEPEESSPAGVADDSAVVVQIINADDDEMVDTASDILSDMGPSEGEAKWKVDVDYVTKTASVYWEANREYVPEPAEPDFGDLDSGDYGPPADFNPCGGY